MLSGSSNQQEQFMNVPEHNDLSADSLHDALEFTRVIFDAAPIGLAMFDDNYSIIDCNETVLAMLSVDKDRFLTDFIRFLPEYQPGGLKSTDKSVDFMKRALNGEKLVTEWVFRSSSGELIVTEVTFTRIFYKDKHVGLGYIYDLRAIKKLESNIVQLKTESEKIYYDPLTGIFNRRFFDENLDRIIKTLSRSNGTLGLMMIDIDYFKDYNDTYGHSAGDDCIRAVAENLSKSVTRADDFIVRYGGDEFAVVLPNTGEEGARHLAEKMLENVRLANIPHEKNRDTGIVTITIGCTTGQVETSHHADDFIKRADALLYISKNDGRNSYTFGPL